MDQDNSFGHLIKQQRKAFALTQSELARRVGCATITLRKIEADNLRPSVQVAERMAVALSIPLEERADFVRFARTAALETPEPLATPTPPPLLEEIGGEDLSGRAVRGYDLGERIGSGGFGAVYRAVQPDVIREVAIKIILPQYANHSDFIRRFEAEAQLVARLEHPYIVPLYDYWREPNAAYLVMRLLRGGSLNDLLKNGPLSPPLTLQFLEQIGAGLHAAHRFGVIHRDLKPANILLDEDQNAYLADFGVAKNLGSPDLQNITQADAIVGSPAYISPEQIRADPILPKADIYCLGVVLYEMLTGHLPFEGPTPIDQIMRHLKDALPPLSLHNPNLPPALDLIIQKATAKDPSQRFPDVLSLLADLRSVVNGQFSVISDQNLVLNSENWILTTEDNPYKGLRPFAEADADDFFGRETLIQELLGRLGEEGELARFLAVVGPSGSGKSSVVKAGLIPAIRRGALPGSENWFVVDFMPGSHPLEELEAALLRIAVNPPASLLTQLKEDERGLLRAVKRILPPDESVELVLVIDQFEEVFTLVSDEPTRAHFLDSLVAAVLEPRSRLHILLTLRADFTDRPLQYVDFGDLLRQRTEFVLPLSPDELELAITSPAKNVGLRLEPGLTSRVVSDLGDQPGILPLLQYALTELFDRREGNTLTLAVYQEIGGVLGALGRRAEEVYASLDESAQAVARQLFLRLVTLGEGVEDTRRRVLLAELESLTIGAEEQRGRGASIVNRFGNYRLLTFDHDPVTRGPTVEVAHEALLHQWSRLRGWLNESRADVRLQRILAQAAAEWTQANHDPGLLLRGTRLTQLGSWAKETTLVLTIDERSFLDASLEARKERQAAEAVRQIREQTLEQRSRHFLRALAGVFAVATVIALVLSGFAFAQQNIAQEEAQARATQQIIAQEQADLAGTSAADAQIEANSRATQQAIAENEADARATQQAIAEEQQAIAENEVEARATQQAIAEEQQALAEAQARVATSRELTSAALVNLNSDPELSILLALQALEVTHTLQAENALHQTILASPVELTLSGHTGLVKATYSLDGSRLATGDEVGLVKIWDTASGQELLTLSGHTGYVFNLAFSPDGTHLASVGDDTTARVWDSATGQELLTLSGHTDWVYGVAFSPDGEHLATGSLDGTVIMWDLTSGEKLFDLVGLTGSILSVAFHPDGRLLATSSDDGSVKLWDATTGQEQLALPIQNQEIFGVVFSPDGTRLAAQGGDTTKVWDLDAESENYGRVLLTLSGIAAGTGIPTVDFTLDGERLLALGADGLVIIWDAATGQELRRLACLPKLQSDLDTSPDGLHVAVTSENGIVKICSLAPSRELLTLAGFADRVYDVTFNADNSRLYTAARSDGIKVWDISEPNTANFGQLLLHLDAEGDRFYESVLSPDETRLATSSFFGSPKIWDSQSGEVLLTLTGHTDNVFDIAFSPDGTRLVSASNDTTAKMWDTITGEELFTLSGHSGWVTNVVFSPDGSYVVTASFDINGFDSTARIWDASNGQELFSLEHEVGVWALAFSPDGRFLATGGNEALVRLWDFKALVETGMAAEPLQMPGHTDAVEGVTFSPDGKHLATTSFDNTTKIWDVATGQELLTLPGHTALVWGAAFSPDGKWVATASWDRTVRLYLLELDELAALALTRVTRWWTLEECQQYLHTDTCPPDIRPVP